MKTIILIVLFAFAATLALPRPKELDICTNDKCQLPNCQCSGNQPPNGGLGPQFVILSFDDAASRIVYDDFIVPNFNNRKNPDECPISGTFFVPHEYTDYSVVNKLYNQGYEIGSHSITKNFSQEYWEFGSVANIISEINGQRQILNKFANIPEQNISGARIPQLRLGKNTFKALQQAGFLYDNSWPSQQQHILFPYTLDYSSEQICHVQSCQTSPVAGLWEIPIIDWVSQEGVPCNSLLACSTSGSADNIFLWMKKNFDYITNWKVPVPLRVNYAWYISRVEHKEALKLFLDFLDSKENVYIVSNSQALEWYRRPSETFSSCQNLVKTSCTERNCKLYLNDAERYMVSCVTCPKQYPWLNNPLGK